MNLCLHLYDEILSAYTETIMNLYYSTSPSFGTSQQQHPTRCRSHAILAASEFEGINVFGSTTENRIQKTVKRSMPSILNVKININAQLPPAAATAPDTITTAPI